MDRLCLHQSEKCEAESSSPAPPQIWHHCMSLRLSLTLLWWSSSSPSPFHPHLMEPQDTKGTWTASEQKCFWSLTKSIASVQPLTEPGIPARLHITLLKKQLPERVLSSRIEVRLQSRLYYHAIITESANHPVYSFAFKLFLLFMNCYWPRRSWLTTSSRQSITHSMEENGRFVHIHFNQFKNDALQNQGWHGYLNLDLIPWLTCLCSAVCNCIPTWPLA